jgi:CRISPR-associated endonuclease/helicase Cas3
MTFDELFERVSDKRKLSPHGWQSLLASVERCENRLIRIPTGFGKTLGVLTAWLWNRVQRADESWPRRLVWCLPMRVLVEQTDSEVRGVLRQLDLLWSGGPHDGKVGVHVLMGGVGADDWHLHPEHCAVLIGTQDMLLSRALNRGYASPRARWPMEFGLLNNDCLWVMDEVQLMDVGLATSAQLQQFRNDDHTRALRPCRTWWMSATLQPEWFRKSPDTTAMAMALEQATLRIVAEQRKGPLWDEEKVSKLCGLESFKDVRALARCITEVHNRGASGPTLVILNKVKRAVDLAETLKKDPTLKSTDIRLIHSRFRPAERATWREEFLNRDACAPGADRIIVATQVVEAGVDISAGVLFTELAPWASLVQRFGRCARWGGTAKVIVADFGADSDKVAAPYALDELSAARDALQKLSNVAPLHLEQFEEAHPELLARLYPYAPKHLLLRHELDELFDTSPDLSGADVDVSRFIRSGSERDVQVFWADIPIKASPALSLKPARDQLCNVPFLDARDWLFEGKSEIRFALNKQKIRMRAWVWDWLDGQWRIAERRDLYPGVTVLVDSKCGGYDTFIGWNPDSGPLKPELLSASVTPVDLEAQADAAEDDESLSFTGSGQWQTIAFHCRQTGQTARGIADRLASNLSSLFNLAGRWHDAGKAHPAFQGCIIGAVRQDLAKAPVASWRLPQHLYRMPDGSRRAGFRHELASTLALFAVLQRHAPDHSALRGPYKALLEKLHPALPGPSSKTPPTSLEREILALDRRSFDLLAWLVCTHHGKVRMAWHASPADQESGDDRLRIRGVCEGDELPALLLADTDGAFFELPSSALDLAPAAAGLNPRTGPGWTERVLGLLHDYGPFTLAWFESLMRAADIRASRQPGLSDPLLLPDNPEHGLENHNPRVAQAPAGNADGASPGARPDTSLAEHGLRARAGRPELAEGATRPPDDATRHFDTAQGQLSYSELATRLAEPLLRIEERIRSGEFAGQPLDQHLLLSFHAELCSSLFPQLAGRYRQTAVQVGAHEPPAAPQVAPRMLDYVRNLEARIQHLPPEPDERWLETLAYAEGELLSIHPFPDLNGRLSRLWLSELLRRLGLPPVDIVPSDPEFRERYLQALAAADRRDWRLLMDLWRERLERPGEQP